MPLEHAPTFETFNEQELHPLQYDADGPLNSFVIDGDTKQYYLDQAIATGSLENQDFSNCPIFQIEERKHHRYDLKRSHEILKLLQKVSANADPSNLAQEVALLQSQNEVTMASLVESCRKLRRGGITDTEKEFLLQCLDDAQSELYTLPEKAVAMDILSQFNAIVGAVDRDTWNSDVTALVDDFYAEYPFLKDQQLEGGERLLISDERLQQFKDVLRARHGQKFDTLRATYHDTLSNDILPDVVNDYLTLRGLRKVNEQTGEYEGWVCRADESINGFRVKPKEKVILCGKRSVQISWKRFEELMMHEVEIHVVRAENGYRAGSFELATGLPGTADAEEGTGLIMEQLWNGTIKESLSRDHFRYIGIAYAFGSIDGRRHSKQETFDFLSSFMMITSAMTQPQESVDIESIIKRQRKICFEHVFRMFRGMPEDRVFLKDLSYYVGKHKIIDLIAQSDASAADVIDYLQQGKFDPTNPVHQGILRTLGLKGTLEEYEQSDN